MILIECVAPQEALTDCIISTDWPESDSRGDVTTPGRRLPRPRGRL